MPTTTTAGRCWKLGTGNGVLGGPGAWVVTCGLPRSAWAGSGIEVKLGLDFNTVTWVAVVPSRILIAGPNVCLPLWPTLNQRYVLHFILLKKRFLLIYLFILKSNRVGEIKIYYMLGRPLNLLIYSLGDHSSWNSQSQQLHWGFLHGWQGHRTWGHLPLLLSGH